MRTSLYWLLTCSAVTHADTAADNWDLFADGRSHALGLRLGHSNSPAWGADLQLMLPATTELSLNYLSTDFTIAGRDEQLTNYSVEFTTDPLATWSAQFIYEYSGDSDSLETKDWGVGVSYNALTWLLGLHYLTGDVDLQTNPLGANAQGRRLGLDRHAIEVQYVLFGDRWQWAAHYRDYRYERSIRLSPTSLLLLRRLGTNTFQQVFGLLDWTASLEGSYQFRQHTLRAGYSQHVLELTEESGQVPYVGWDYALNDDVSLGVLGALGLGDSEHYGELSLRYRF